MAYQPRYTAPAQRKQIEVPPVHIQAQDLWKVARNRECTLCPLHREARTVCIFGNGVVPAVGMVVSDAPEGEDDEFHRPFLGPGADYLKNVLRNHQIDFDALYVTSAVKCKPPEKNRDKELEKAQVQCAHYLETEIATVKPKAILAMGPEAFWFFTHQKGLLKERGQAFKWREKEESPLQQSLLGFGADLQYTPWIIPTIHPNYVRTYPAYDRALNADVKMFREFLTGNEPNPPVNLIYVDTMEDWAAAEAELWEDKDKILTFDLETRGFKDHDQPGAGYSQVWCAAFTRGRRDETGMRTFMVPLEHPDSPFLAEKLENWQHNWNAGPLNFRVADQYHPLVEGVFKLINEARLNGHNVKYDIRNTLGQFARRYDLNKEH